MKKVIKEIFRLIGYQMVKYPAMNADMKRRMDLVNHFNINKIFDVGANKGQYATIMRKHGFKGEIISFEPMKEAFSELLKVSSLDSSWRAENIALGNSDSETTINIAGNSISSSIFNMLPSHIKAAPGSVYIGSEKVAMKKLDTVLSNYFETKDNVLLKIDVQGFEKNVLEGAEQSLGHIKGIQLEMSLVHLYEGGILFREMWDYLEAKGFQLFSLENVFSDYSTGQLLCVDGIFYKTS